MEMNRTHRTEWIGAILFLSYLMLLMYFMFFSEKLGRTDADRIVSYNLQPLKEILRFWKYRDVLGYKAVFWNLGGNVLCFMPFGVFVMWLWKNMDRWYLVTSLSLYLSLLIELVQYFMKVGSFDVDDLLLNTIGGFLGYICCKIWRFLCL
ncbi:MAG: VanZ family protein [Lachnospiraceae bacterium]|nr:VanZ family protein [Lachnospiraceae bacterium]